MKISVPFASIFLVVSTQCAAFVPAHSSSSRSSAAFAKEKGGSASELGLPCEDECALESYPNLPPSVHPGVLSGQAQMDLLNHAKENGKILFANCDLRDVLKSNR